MDLTELIQSRRERHLAGALRVPSYSVRLARKASTDPTCKRAAQWVAEHLKSAGFKTVEIVPTDLHPLVYAESLEAPGKPTVLFYGHYDVQPAEPLDLWTSPPFEPETRDGNILWTRHGGRQRASTHSSESAGIFARDRGQVPDEHQGGD